MGKEYSLFFFVVFEASLTDNLSPILAVVAHLYAVFLDVSVGTVLSWEIDESL